MLGLRVARDAAPTRGRCLLHTPARAANRVKSLYSHFTWLWSLQHQILIPALLPAFGSTSLWLTIGKPYPPCHGNLLWHEPQPVGRHRAGASRRAPTPRLLGHRGLTGHPWLHLASLPWQILGADQETPGSVCTVGLPFSSSCATGATSVTWRQLQVLYNSG